MQQRDPQQWCFVSGKVSALETTLLRDGFFQRFLELDTDIDIDVKRREYVLSRIRDSALSDYFHTTDDLADYEGIISRRFLEQVREIRKCSPSPVVCDFFLLPYDFMNLKNYLKEKLFGLPPSERFPCAAGDDVWERLWKETSMAEGNLPQLRPTGVYEEAVSALKRLIGIDGTGADDPGRIDGVLDGHLLRYLPELIAGLRSERLDGYVRDYLRLRAIAILQRVPTGREAEMLWFLRGDEFFEYLVQSPPRHWKDMLLEVVPEAVVEKIVAGERKSLLLRYERHVSDYMMERLRFARYTAFGPERVFGYLSGLDTELFNLRLAIGGAMENLDPRIIGDTLRRTYI
jgi:vacuolar-type H+-ATPase subunit C/Vma6